MTRTRSAAFLSLAMFAFLLGCSGTSSTPAPTATAPTANLSATAFSFPGATGGTATAAQSATLTNNGTATLTITGITLGGTDAALFTLTNGCSTALAVGSSCTISATYKATDLTARTAVITVATNAANASQSIALSGQAVTVIATLSTTSLSFTGTTIGTATATQTATLTNSGTAAVSLSGITLGGADASFFTLTNTCGISLAVGSSCTISASYKATDVTARAATITVASNATAPSQTIALSGQAIAPTATLSATSLTFGGATISTATPPQTVTVTNKGTAALTFTSIAVGGTDSTLFTLTNGCGSSLAIGASCTLSVVFKAADTLNHTATINLTTNAVPSTQTIALSGVVTNAPTATLSTNLLSYSGTTTGSASAPQTVTLTNNGNGLLTLTGVTLGGPDASFYTLTNNCGATVAVGASCTFSVVFKPTDLTFRSASITVLSNASAATQTVTLSGSVSPTPLATLSATTLSFGTVGAGSTSAAQTVQLNNTGTGPLTITSVSLTGTDTAFFKLTNGCGTTLAVGSSCSISAVFSPTDATSRSATITIVTNATPASQTVALTGSGFISQCSSSTSRSTQFQPQVSLPGAAFTGRVLACSLPVVGSSVQLYAAGTTGNGSAPTALGAPILTDTTGSFSVAAGYTCPSDLSTLYLVARGGKAGVNGITNSATVLMTALGSCKSVTGTPSFLIDEVTTVASAYALGQLLSAGGNIGASATNVNGLLLAAGSEANLVNLTTGFAPGASFPSTGTPPTLNLNALSNALTACITSSAGASASACSQLFSATAVAGTAPTNTLDAMLNLVRHPAVNVDTLFALTRASTYYAPAAPASPSDWTLFVTYTGAGIAATNTSMSGPAGLGIDSAGNIAVANYFSSASFFTNTGQPITPNGLTGNNLRNSYGLAVSPSNAVWIPNEQSPGSINGGIGTVTVFSSITAAPTAVTYSAGGLNYPVAIAFDSSQIAWVVDYGNSHVTLLNSAGTPISGATGYTSDGIAFPVAVAIDSKKFGYIANQSSNSITRIAQDGSGATNYVTGSGPSGVAVDAADNVWVANYYGSSVGLLSSNQTIISSGITGGGINQPQGIAIDGAGNAWIANYRGPSLSELAAYNTSSPGAALSPSIGYGRDAQLLEAFAIAIDSAGNIWVTNFGNDTLTEFVGLAAPVKTPLAGPVALP